MLLHTIIATVLMASWILFLYESEKFNMSTSQSQEICTVKKEDNKPTKEFSNSTNTIIDGYWKNYYETLLNAEKKKKAEIAKQEKNSGQTETVKSTDIIQDKQALGLNSYIIKGIKGIYQLPELPTGCEATALTIIMNYNGINVDKYEIAMEYMPRMNLYYEKGILYGPNPMHVFAGTPSSVSGLGCFIPCICTTARKYFNANKQIKSNYKIVDLSGKDLRTLLEDYVSQDNPLLVIVTPNLSKQFESLKWQIYHGKEWQWMSNHHAMVIYGFDNSKNKIYVCDPLRENGKYTYNLDKFEEIYNSKGKNAMTITKKNKA